MTASLGRGLYLRTLPAERKWIDLSPLQSLSNGSQLQNRLIESWRLITTAPLNGTRTLKYNWPPSSPLLHPLFTPHSWFGDLSVCLSSWLVGTTRLLGVCLPMSYLLLEIMKSERWSGKVRTIYRKLALIDLGSFGKVYLAYHTMTKTKVGSSKEVRSNSVGRHKGSWEIRYGRLGKRDLPSSKATTSSHHKTLRSNTYGETCLASYRVLSRYLNGYRV